MTVFIRSDESLDHFRFDIITVELIDLVQPEVIAAPVSVGRCIWIASQVAKILHQHKCPVEFQLSQGGILDDLSQGASPRPIVL